MMEVARISETSVDNILHGSTSQKTNLNLIQKVFDKASFEATAKATNRRGVEPTICRWMDFMLERRSVADTLSGETLGVTATRGSPQGKVLSPHMWSLVVDDLL
jgi:hypothetical protein